MSAPLDELHRIIEENATLLGEPVALGVHVLRDGRIRVFDLALGWRRHGYREYTSVDAALRAGEIANRRAKHVSALVKGGMRKWTAIADAKQAIHL